MGRIKIMAGLGVGVALAAAGCATGVQSAGSGGTGGNGGAAPPGGSATVSVRSVGGVDNVLVDPAGRPLYAADQERGGMVKCVADCVAIWAPVTVPNGVSPHGGAGLTGTLGTVARPDGKTQVTWNSSPLYTFTLDPSGKVTGNGKKDTFGGTSFTWHVQTMSGAGAPSQAPSQPDSGGYGY
ncbi:MAG TPA: hypothetical protein VF054_09760 [Micromonosporaceae bacterium]